MCALMLNGNMESNHLPVLNKGVRVAEHKQYLSNESWCVKEACR